MSKKIHFFFIFTFLFILLAQAQKNKDSLHIAIDLNWKNESLKLYNKYHSSSDLLEITTLKFYLSGIEIQYDDATKFIQKDRYHLVDIEDENSLIIPICKTSNKMISKVIFSIGVDSLASVSGALSGALDPVKGMYWAWQSGYINMKIEGRCSSCNPEASRRKNGFQFHIGGYLQPNYAIRKIEIPITKTQILTNEIRIQVDAATLFDAIKLDKVNSIMVPGTEAMKIADLSAKMFIAE